MLFIVAAAAVSLTATDVPPSTLIEGRWENPSHTVIVNIAPCGASLCGTVEWATAEAQQESRKGAPRLIGTPLLTDLQPNGSDWKGKLFIPDKNMHVEAKIAPAGAGHLNVEGCEIGICKTQLWSKVEGPLPTAQ